MSDWFGLQEFIDGEALSMKSYKKSADSFICTLILESSSPHIQYTPGGYVYTSSTHPEVVVAAHPVLQGEAQSREEDDWKDAQRSVTI
jgi:hypothetical protein